MTTYQAHAHRREKAAVKAAMREVAPEEFGECELCGFLHNRPMERSRCPLCGRVLCLGDPVCGCEGMASEASGKLMDAVGAACANTGPHGDIFAPSSRRSHAT
jgi:hypothetical protein